MKTLTATDALFIFEKLRLIERLTTAMRAEVRAPTPQELYPAAAAVDVIRYKLMSVCLADVAVEPAELVA